MAGQLIRPTEVAPPSLNRLSPAESIEAWIGLIEFTEEFWLAGMRSRIGPEGDLQAEIRRWNEIQLEIRDEELERQL